MAQDASYFRRLTEGQLDFAIKDIVGTMDLAATWDDKGVGGNKYADQYHAAVGERNRRTERNVCQSCKRPL
jgi:hypothetical protein